MMGRLITILLLILFTVNPISAEITINSTVIHDENDMYEFEFVYRVDDEKIVTWNTIEKIYQLYDISTPFNPTFVESMSLTPFGSANQPLYDDNYLYYVKSDLGAKLSVVDKHTLVEIGSTYASSPRSYFYGNYIIQGRGSGFRVINNTDPTSIDTLKFYDIGSGSFYGFGNVIAGITGDYMYLVKEVDNSDFQLHIYDLTDITDVTLVNSIAVPNGARDCFVIEGPDRIVMAVALQQEILYYDVSDPENILELFGTPASYPAYFTSLAGSFPYFFIATGNGLDIVDVSASPTVVASDSTYIDKMLFVEGNPASYIYAVDGNDDFYTFEVTGLIFQSGGYIRSEPSSNPSINSHSNRSDGSSDSSPSPVSTFSMYFSLMIITVVKKKSHIKLL